MASTATKSSRLKAAYGHFAETTTFGGPVHTYISRTRSWRWTWVLITALMVAATMWNTYYVLTDYLSYPVNVKIEVTNQPSVPFPTVTICNRNPISCTKLAYAYVKYKEELNDVMVLSQCADSLKIHPLISRLVRLILRPAATYDSAGSSTE